MKSIDGRIVEVGVGVGAFVGEDWLLVRRG